MARTWMWLLCATLLLMARAAIAAPSAVDAQELEVDHALTTEFPTPHTDWGHPYALGKTRVLFFCQGANTAPRECVELIQRFDLDAQAVFWTKIVDTDKSQWHGGELGIRRMLGLLAQRWDALVFFGISPEKLPPEAAYRVVEAAANGAGLVLVGVDLPQALKAKNRLGKPPAFLAVEEVGEAFTVAKGRAIRLPARPLIEYAEGWQVEDDHWHERVGRAVIWAAGKEPGTRLDIDLPKRSMPDQVVVATIKLTGTPVAGPVEMDMELRGGVDPSIVWPPVPVVPGKPLEMVLPSRPAGRYWLDVRIRGPRGIENWSTAPIEFVAKRCVQTVELQQDWGEIGQRIRGKVRLGNCEQPGTTTLRLSLLDRRRRELVRRDVRAVEPIEFDFPVEPWMPMLVTVQAELIDGPNELSQAYAYFRVVQRGRGKFNFLVWDFPTGTLAPYAEESLVRQGMTLQLNARPDPPKYVAAFDISYVPYTTRILTPKTAAGVMSPFCWNDAAAVRVETSRLAAKYQPSRQHGAYLYSLGDENTTQGSCLSPHCQEAYRRYLREVYGDLAKLNQSWGSQFLAWSEVGLSKADDNDEAAAWAAKNYPRWFDRQAFKSYNYVRYCQQYAAAYRKIDPQAITGFEGAGKFTGGDDLDLIVRSLDFWSPYPGTADEVVRSIAPRSFPRANWMGYTKDADSLLGQYWRMVLLGMDSVWWWRWDCIGAFHGWLAPDLRPYPAVKEILNDTRVIREGLGDVLLRLSMHDDGVAMLYSYPSTFAQRIGDAKSFGDYEQAHVRMHDTLRDLGLQFRYITDRMLRQGEADLSRFKVLLLIRAEAMSDAEAAAIRRYAEQGGTVLADVRPGTFDEHCKPRAAGALDDLFGIERAPSQPAVPVTMKPDNTVLSGWKVDRLLVDPSVRAGGAKPMVAGGPVALMGRSVGKGRAVLLNFALSSAPKVSAPDTPEAVADWWLGVLATAGVKPAVQVRGTDGRRLRGVQVVRWANGTGEFLAVLHSAGRREDARVQLANRGYARLYDLRARASLGPQSEVPVTLTPNRPAWLAALPASAPRLRWYDVPSAVTRGSRVRLRLGADEAGVLLPVTVRATCGPAPLEWFDRTVVAGEQPAEIVLPIAYNDPTGTYELRAVSGLSGEEAVARFEVRSEAK